MRNQYALELMAVLWFCLMGFAFMEQTEVMDRLGMVAGVIGAIYITRAFYQYVIKHELKGEANAKKSLRDGGPSRYNPPGGVREYSGPSRNRIG